MWFLPSRSRPHNLKSFIEACQKTNTSTPFLIILDNDDPELEKYREIRLPYNWGLKIAPHRTHSGLFNEAFRDWPNLDWYGIIADDVIPRTNEWDKILTKSCKPDKISYADDLMNGERHTTHFCIGGELAREIGWLHLPGLDRTYGDNVWMDIGKDRNCLRYHPDVILEHLHYTNGKSPLDETYKKHSKTKDKEIYEKWRGISINFVCVNVQNYCGMGVEYVNKLYDMVSRNLPDGFSAKFTVFTDELDPSYNPRIIQRIIEDDLNGWWNKIYLFKEGIFETNERIIYFDLDTVIVGKLDDIVDYRGKFATLQDFYRPYGLGPAVILWTPTKETESIWEYFKSKEWPVDYITSNGAQGDQAVFEEMRQLPDNFLQRIDILQNTFPGAFKSYKIECKFGVPSGTRVVCFHGLPRPHQADVWVPNIWKIGGGSVLELEVIGNVNEDILEKNIISALSLPVEILRDQYMIQTDKELAIVGGGPSLKDDLLTLSIMSKSSAIWALNGAFHYLCENGIEPDAHIILDAREQNINFLPEKTGALLLYSAQCHPKVLEMAQKVSEKVIIWCPSVNRILKILDQNNKRAAIVAGGSSVGLKAIGLAHLFGFNKVHLFGYDSSYKEDKNHAYTQSMNDGETVIEVTVNGKTFKCAPWMATQADEFKSTAQDFVKNGMEITVHGSGLLPYISTLLQ